MQIPKMNRRGQVVGLVGDNLIAILGLVVVVIAVLIAFGALSPTSFFSANSLNANATNALIQNTTIAAGSFGGNIPTAFTVFGVVFILGFLAILIYVVVKMKSAGSSGGGL